MIKFVRNTFIPGIHNKFHPHFFRHNFVALFLVFNLFIGLFNFWFIDQAKKNDSWLAQVQSAILIQNANKSREENGLNQLRTHPLLDLAAQAKAEDMASKGYFSHTSPDGKKPWDFISSAGYNYSHAGENLAVNFIDSDKLHESWMNSETHRKNIIHKEFTEIGIGTATGTYNGKEAIFIVQMFGRQKALPLKKITTTQTVNKNEVLDTKNEFVWVAGNYLSSLDGQTAGPYFKTGTSVYVNSLGLNQRTSPGGKIIGQIKQNTIGEIAGSAMVENNVVWVPVVFSDKIAENIILKNIAGASVGVYKQENTLAENNQINTNQKMLPQPILAENETRTTWSISFTKSTLNIISIIPYVLIAIVIFGIAFLIGTKAKQKKLEALAYGMLMLTTVWGIALFNIYLNQAGLII